VWKQGWEKLKSGLYAPPLLTRLHRDQQGLAWFPCCGDCVCNDCSGTTPSQLQIAFTGYSNNGCSNCADFNDTFICDCVSGLQNPCYWRYIFPEDVCDSNNKIEIEFNDFGASSRISGTIDLDAGFSSFREDLAASQDCAAWNGLSLSHWLTQAGFTAECSIDLGTASCLITAL